MLYTQNPLEPPILNFLLARLSYIDLQRSCPVASAVWLWVGLSSAMLRYFTFVYLCTSRQSSQGLNNTDFNGFGRRSPKTSGYFIATQSSIKFPFMTLVQTHTTLATRVALWWLSIECCSWTDLLFHVIFRNIFGLPLLTPLLCSGPFW